MKRRMYFRASAMVIGLSVLTGPVWAESHDKGKPVTEQPPGMPDPEAMHAMWEKLAQPGPEHERFKKLVGPWKAEWRHWHEPGGEPEVTYAKAEYRLLFGGRYLEESVQGEHMGKPFEGRGITGYDNFKKKYVLSWIDNAGTGIMLMEGDYDQATKTMTAIGEFATPMGTMKMRFVDQEISADERLVTMYMTHPGEGESKAMEIAYKRG